MHYLFCVISTGLGLRIAKFVQTGPAVWCLDLIAHSIVIYTRNNVTAYVSDDSA